MTTSRFRMGSAGVLRLLLVASVVLLATGIAIFAALAPASAAKPQPDTTRCATGVDLYGFSDALDKQAYGGTDVGGLSGLTYDRKRDVYYSLVDNQGTTAARFYTLRLPVDGSGLGEPEVLDVTTLRDENGQPFTGANFDGEGIAITPDNQLLVSSETEPSIRRFALDGTYLGALPVPERFIVQKQNNQTFESLSLSPNGRSLFTANEGYLTGDGETTDGSDRLRILRYEDRGPSGFEPTDQYYYLADPGLGVTDIAALSESELLVLERGFVAGEGNTVRIYRVSLDGAEDVSGVESLAAPGLEPVEKDLLVDLTGCPSEGVTTPGTQENPLLDNYESLTLGPRLPGGDRSLLLQSDDNFGSGQVTRVVALDVENGQLRTRR